MSFKGKVAWQLGFDLKRINKGSTTRALTVRLLDKSRPTVVLDVGANVGQFARAALAFNRDVRVISFEAVGATHSRLVEAARGKKSWTVAPQSAIGNETGVATVNISAESQCSSLLPILPAHVNEAPKSAYIGVEQVPVYRLDEIARNYLRDDDRIFLKSDTQGFERQVLEGASGLMSRVVAIQIELSYSELYAGSDLAFDMIQMVKDMNFRLFGLSNGLRAKATGELLSGDGFFIRN